MYVILFVCLVFTTTIIANDLTTSQYESSLRNIIYNQGSIRKLVTDRLNEPLGGVAQSMNITENKTNATGNITKEPIIKEQDKNGTTTKKPTTEIERLTAESSQTVISYPPYSTYEVTENVIDIPDNRFPAGPIDTNFNARPLIFNLGKPNNKTDTTIDKTTEADIKTKKNRISILHFDAEFDDKVHVVHENKVTGVFKGIKEYLHSFKRGIVKGFHNFFHKHQDVHDHGEVFKRAVDGIDSLGESHGVQNVDKTEHFINRRHY